MIKLDDFFKSGTPLGIAIGIGATVLATAVIPALPALARAARPGARAAIKSGLLFAEKGREIMAEVKEELEDILAEVSAELQDEDAMEQSDSTFHAEAASQKDDL